MAKSKKQAKAKKAAKPAAAPKAEKTAASARQPLRHRTTPGETLSNLSLRYYQTPRRWKDIYEANKRVLGDNPREITAGQVLVIPNTYR